METIHPSAALSTFYQVPHEYTQAAEAAWNEA
jgi:hypothetical protein